jgi:hypothetical protein
MASVLKQAGVSVVSIVDAIAIIAGGTTPPLPVMIAMSAAE